MSRSLSAFTAFVLLLVLLLTFSQARQLPPSPQEFLDPHNEARAAVGVGPLQWSSALEKAASLAARLQRDKHACAFANLTGSRYGGNQLYASGGAAIAPRDAVATWVAEGKYYTYANNSCAAEHSTCGVYTQVVWRKSRDMGCAQVTCPQNLAALTICFYDPPGNVVGEKPY